jgi:CRISPR/Cas system-associated exonuclease Cas4 (RecB family)
MGMPPRVELLVKKHMIEKRLANDRHHDVFHPSAWGSCLRKVAYSYYNEKSKFLEILPEEVDTRMERIFDNGHGVHARWQAYGDNSRLMRGAWRCANPICGAVYGDKEKLGIFNPAREQGWACSCGCRETDYQEVLVEDKQFNFYGHVDAIFDVRGSPFEQKDDADVFVVDFKSMKDEYFGELTQPKPEHVIQVHIYMWLLGLSAAVVVYENKNSQELREFVVKRNEKVIERIKEESAWMQAILKENLLPPRVDGAVRSDMPCRLCEFQKLCWSSAAR